MAPNKTFKLNLPANKQIEVHLVELEDGRIVARTAEELQLAAVAAAEAARG